MATPLCFFHHIHLVERAFLFIVRIVPPAVTEPEDFPAAVDLQAYAREYHREALQFIPSHRRKTYISPT